MDKRTKVKTRSHTPRIGFRHNFKTVKDVTYLLSISLNCHSTGIVFFVNGFALFHNLLLDRKRGKQKIDKSFLYRCNIFKFISPYRCLDLNREFPNSTNFSLLENRLFRFGGE